MAAPGNLVFVEGDQKAEYELRGGSREVDDFLYEIVDEIAYYAAGRIKEHAPGHIDQLVDVNPADEINVGVFEAIAGVEPDIIQENFRRGLGSDPADFPVFVEVGTGIYGPIGEPISTIPGHLMGPFWDPWSVRDIFTSVVKGQKPQRFTEHAFQDTVGWLPARIRQALHDLSERH